MDKRLTIFAGHYGSGKTNLAVNYALALKKKGYPVKIADLDIVNPYFRTKDSEKELQEAGIPLISPAYANSNVDLPALPQELYSLVQRRDFHAVLDVGGDDRGAYALGRYTPYILEENDYRMVFVANFYRPLTQTPEEALEVMGEIEVACGIRFNCIVNNSNLGGITTAADIRATEEKAKKLCELSGLPLWMTSAEASVAEDGWFPMNLQEKYYDIKLTFNSDLCKGCGLCVDACPKHLIVLAKDKINAKGHSPAEITDQEKCIGCAFCATMCPDCIITVEK